MERTSDEVCEEASALRFAIRSLSLSWNDDSGVVDNSGRSVGSKNSIAVNCSEGEATSETVICVRTRRVNACTERAYIIALLTPGDMRDTVYMTFI